MKYITQHPIKKSDLGFHGNLFGGKLLAWLDLAKQKLLEIVENDLSRVSNSESGKIWKSNFKKTVNRLYTLEQVYMKANDLLMQDNHLTRSRW